MLFLLDSAGVPSLARSSFVTSGPGGQRSAPGRRAADRIGVGRGSVDLPARGRPWRMGPSAGWAMCRAAASCVWDGAGAEAVVPASRGLAPGTYIATLSADHAKFPRKSSSPDPRLMLSKPGFTLC